MFCAAQEQIFLWPVLGESVLSLAADLVAADAAFLETRIPKKSQLAENSCQGFESTNRPSHPEKIAAKSTTALGVSCFRRSGTAVGSGVVYDGDGNRVSETAGGVTTKYLIDTLNPTGYSQVLDELVSGAVTKIYTYGLQRISENQHLDANLLWLRRPRQCPLHHQHRGVGGSFCRTNKADSKLPPSGPVRLILAKSKVLCPLN
jgi:hypothetical protein